MKSIDEKAARAYNTFKDQISMVPQGSVLLELSLNRPAIVNPYKQKPSYKDNRHTWVPERDIRPPEDLPYIPPPMPGFSNQY